MLHHARLNLTLILLILSGCTLTMEPTPLTPTPSLPSARFLYPANNALVYEGTTLPIEIVATDDVQGISRIELYIDAFTDESPYQSASPVADDAVPVFTTRMNWVARGVNRHQLTAVAYRADGLQSDEVTIVIEVIAREDVPEAAPTQTLAPTPS